jgi:chitodextrinase
MKRLITILVLALGSTGVARAVPVVPNFQQGSMTSHTETESTVTETINSIDYRTGWEYTVTGVGVENNGSPLNPTVSTTTVQVSPTVGTGRRQQQPQQRQLLRSIH